MKRSHTRNSIFLFSIFLTFSLLCLISSASAQGQYSMYLNKIGECNIDVGYDVAVIGNYAYVTNNEGTMIVDVSNPKIPTKVAEILGNTPINIQVDEVNGYCFTPPGSGGLIISDISNPLDPQTIVTSSIGGNVITKIVIDGTYVFISLRNLGYRIYNFSNPDFDLIYSYLDSNGESVAVKEDILYFGNPNTGIKVFNISDISNPDYIRTLSTSTSAMDMFIHENRLYVGRHADGIRIYNLSNLTNPALLKNLNEDDGGEAQGVAADDDFLYVADYWRLEVYNMSNPTIPVEIAEATKDIGVAHDLYIDGEYVYVALGGGLEIFELSDTQSSYIPRYIYYVIPIAVVSVGGGIFLIIRFQKRKKTKGN